MLPNSKNSGYESYAIMFLNVLYCAQHNIWGETERERARALRLIVKKRIKKKTERYGEIESIQASTIIIIHVLFGLHWLHRSNVESERARTRERKVKGKTDAQRDQVKNP